MPPLVTLNLYNYKLTSFKKSKIILNIYVIYHNIIFLYTVLSVMSSATSRQGPACSMRQVKKKKKKPWDYNLKKFTKPVLPVCQTP